jgi:hypothetical protein
MLFSNIYNSLVTVMVALLLETFQGVFLIYSWLTH